MSNAYPHLTDATAQLLELPVRERVRSVLVDRFVYHEQVTDLIKHCEFMMYRPRGIRPTGILAFGTSNSGKTALAAALDRRCKVRRATPEHPASKPIAYFSMSGAQEAKEIFMRFLNSLDAPPMPSMTGTQRRVTALKLAQEADLRLLIIDEIQDVLSSTPRQQALALVAIKDIMNSLKIPVLALGTDNARNALEADQHLKGRFQFRGLPSWRCDDYLRHFLEAYESTLPLKKRSKLGALLMMKVIVKESEGVLGLIVERLQRAAALAIEGGQEQITAELFERARFEVPETDLSEEAV
jgi:hypothetical protein